MNFKMRFIDFISMWLLLYAFLCVYMIIFLFSFFNIIYLEYLFLSILILCPIYSAFFIFVFLLEEKYFNKNAIYLKNKINVKRKVFCHGFVSFCKKIGLCQGWLFLSEDALEFYSFKNIFNDKGVVILLDDIVEVVAGKIKIYIYTKDRKYSFFVYNSNGWKKYIDDVVNYNI